MDYIVRALSMDGAIRIFAADTTQTVNEAVRVHDCFPTAAAALGRTITGAAIMGAMLKGEGDSITLQINGGGPIGRILAVSKADLKVKGYCDEPHVDLDRRPDGKLDVGTAVGKNGYLSVVRDFGLKEPYVGKVSLSTGEIGDDLTLYFARSEQVPSAVGLGVLVDTDYTIKAAGGFVIQLMPGATDEHINAVETAINQTPSVTELLDYGMTPEDIIEKLLPDFSVMYSEPLKVEYRCDCSRKRMEKALISIGRKDLEELVNEDEKAELVCHFCNKKYNFGKSDLERLLNK